MPWAGTVAPRSVTTARPRTPLSATLAANEALARRRQRGEPVLPLAFGESGLPVPGSLRQALSTAAGQGGYGPVAGLPELREAVAGYWTRRGLPTSTDAVICGPGSKPLLFATLLAIGADVAVPRPSWVSYAAQGRLAGAGVHHVAAPPGEGGICDPAALADAVEEASAAGRRIGAVIVTLPDNPTGRLARPVTVRALCEVAAAYDLTIISDEIYRDLIHDPAAEVLSPAEVAPDRTVVTTALSKNLALGGWRLGAARMPAGPAGAALRDRVLGVASEIWSAPAAPVQQAAAGAFSEPEDIRERISASRSLHAALAGAVAGRCAAAGLLVPAPQAAFYVYPDFEPWRAHLRSRRGIRTGAELAGHLLERYGAGVLPGSAFGEREQSLRMRMATALLYGETDEQRETALTAADPVALPWIAAALTRLSAILADLAPPAAASVPGHHQATRASAA
ncbi:MAG TPA: pyridoxal phosphate-dependent aminotransferase [Streptosporangiaceae bacterium]|jgi:aspartate aminotransferase